MQLLENIANIAAAEWRENTHSLGMLMDAKRDKKYALFALKPAGRAITQKLVNLDQIWQFLIVISFQISFYQQNEAVYIRSPFTLHEPF